MRTGTVRRAARDVASVSRTACPAAAARWMAGLITSVPECARTQSLSPADRAWARTGARFRTPSAAVISLPTGYTAGAREMFCRNVYFRTGLTMPSQGWVIDLGANHGLFSVWAAVTGAQVVAVEGQEGFATVIENLARHNRVDNRVHIEIGMASGVDSSGGSVGVVADDQRWATTSHGGMKRPADISVPLIMSKYKIDRIGLLKIDIEGGEFAVMGDDEDLSWLSSVDQIVLEVHQEYGNTEGLIDRLQARGFSLDLRDNEGSPVTLSAGNLEYAYGRRRV